ncbi:hypothetical protein KHS38_12670 [Mucilaginibacter sp. Bleaf8]|uniref:hypothetical protein n=1 Tax=Mucilaginibacter sp. Bleaf8 TaxID=2834430 RepID=UPI001BCA7187|nr:hypothetical protein [Mucilaginibacter sp. Bleaf8]MBS7565259.1 hypothetical protein [Mucilaginibacter sp. Bleaf8]
MQQRKIALANIAGTTLMTAFSHLMSSVRNKNFSEPVLLSKFLEKAPVNVDSKYAKPAGWVGHYLVGHAFAGVYQLILDKQNAKPSFKKGLAMGILSGVAGIGIWKAAFKLHPNPPKTPAKEFFTQLLLAHVVFGLVTDGVLQLLEKAKETTVDVKIDQADDTYYPLQDEQAIVSPS